MSIAPYPAECVYADSDGLPGTKKAGTPSDASGEGGMPIALPEIGIFEAYDSAKASGHLLVLRIINTMPEMTEDPV